MTPRDPSEWILRYLRAMQPFLARYPQFAERVIQQAALYREMAITEPVSLRHQLSELHAAPDFTPAMVQEYFEAIAPIAEGAPPDFSYYPVAQDLFTFFQRAAEASSPEMVRGHLSRCLVFDLPIMRAALIEAMRPDETSSFERRTRALAEVLRNGAEGWYKPILQCALAVSYEARGQMSARVPSELGALMAAIKNAPDLPVSILSDEVRLIRNAVAHSSVRIDVTAATVTFVNRKRSGDEEVLGPLTWSVLHELSQAVLNLWWGLALVCRKQRRLLSAARQ